MKKKEFRTENAILKRDSVLNMIGLQWNVKIEITNHDTSRISFGARDQNGILRLDFNDFSFTLDGRERLTLEIFTHANMTDKTQKDPANKYLFPAFRGLSAK